MISSTSSRMRLRLGEGAADRRPASGTARAGRRRGWRPRGSASRPESARRPSAVPTAPAPDDPDDRRLARRPSVTCGWAWSLGVDRRRRGGGSPAGPGRGRCRPPRWRPRSPRDRARDRRPAGRPRPSSGAPRHRRGRRTCTGECSDVPTGALYWTPTRPGAGAPARRRLTPRSARSMKEARHDARPPSPIPSAPAPRSAPGLPDALPARRRRPTGSTSTRCRSRSRSCSRTCSATPAAASSAPRTSRPCSPGGRASAGRGRDPVHAGARAPPGLHRRPGRRRPRGHARRDGRPRRRPGAGQPARAGRPRHRPLGPGRPVRDARRVRLQRRARVRAQRRALPAPALGADRVPRPARRAARDRHRPPGQPRVPRHGDRRPARSDGGRLAFPDTVVGTDSHTTMVNGLGVLGYGVGGIEAEAVLLGQPLYQPMPHVVGVRLHGALPRGSTATDLVLVVTEMLRAPRRRRRRSSSSPATGWPRLSLADRATISNMSPEFGATSTLFPIDDETLAYLRLTGRSPERVDLVERYARTQGLWREPGDGPTFDELLELDLAQRRAVRGRPAPAAGPRPADRRCATTSGRTSRTASKRPIGSLRAEEPVPGDGAVEEASADSFPASDPTVVRDGRRDDGPRRRPTRRRPTRRRSTAAPTGRSRSRSAAGASTIRTGSVAIAAITSCTNTSNPTVMVGAGLLARNAVARGLRVGPTVKTSLAPGLAGGHRLPRGGRADGAARDARLRAGRLRLHDLHRQLRPARRGRRRGGRGQRPGRRGRAVGQPQLRGPDPPAGAGELPRLAAAGRRVRPRRPGRHRPHDRAARHRQRRPAGLPRRHLAGARRDPLGHRRRDRSGAVPSGPTRPSSRATIAGARCRSRPAIATPGTTTRPTSPSRRSSTVSRSSRGPSPTSPAPASSPSSATRSRPTTSRRPARSRRRRPPASGSRRTASVRSSSTRTARAAATTR